MQVRTKIEIHLLAQLIATHIRLLTYHRTLRIVMATEASTDDVIVCSNSGAGSSLQPGMI